MHTPVTQHALAQLFGVHQSAFANYKAWKAGAVTRRKYITDEQIEIIEKAHSASKTRLVELHLERFSTITPAEAFTRYGLHALGQRIGELNARYRRDNIPRRIDNIAPRGAGVHGVYRLTYLEEAK